MNAGHNHKMHGFTFILGFVVFLIIVFCWPIDALSPPKRPTNNPNDTQEQITVLTAENAALKSRLDALEEKVKKTEKAHNELRYDYSFAHPTVEYEYIKWDVKNWTKSLKADLQHMSIPFQTGAVIGAFCSWQLFLTLNKAKGQIGATLFLEGETYNKGALFAGYSMQVVNGENQVFNEASLGAIDFLQSEDRSYPMPNLLTLKQLRTASNKLVTNDTLRLRFRLELLAFGHHLYPSEMPQETPSRHSQAVIFDIKDFHDSITSGADGDSLAHTKFSLTHPWAANTTWNAELKMEANSTMSLHMQLDNCTWNNLYAYFSLNIMDVDDNILDTQNAPLHDYKKQVLVLENVMPGEKRANLTSLANSTVEFRLTFTVFGKNARYYSDIY